MKTETLTPVDADAAVQAIADTKSLKTGRQQKR